jgi:hypothetical protein
MLFGIVEAFECVLNGMRLLIRKSGGCVCLHSRKHAQFLCRNERTKADCVLKGNKGQNRSLL